MKLIIGLGNPGKKFEQTWHNVGFMVINEIQRKEPGAFCQFKVSKKFKAEICESGQDLEKLVLAKPQTFMNNSGQAVKALAKFYKTNNSWIIHDDIDLPLGKIRISQNASAAGHKGVQSIIDELGTQEFIRFRLGIKPPTPSKLPTEKYVLQKISSPDRIIIDESIKTALAAIELALDQGITEAMNEFN